MLIELLQAKIAHRTALVFTQGIGRFSTRAPYDCPPKNREILRKNPVARYDFSLGKESLSVRMAHFDPHRCLLFRFCFRLKKCLKRYRLKSEEHASLITVDIFFFYSFGYTLL